MLSDPYFPPTHSFHPPVDLEPILGRVQRLLAAGVAFHAGSGDLQEASRIAGVAIQDVQALRDEVEGLRRALAEAQGQFESAQVTAKESTEAARQLGGALWHIAAQVEGGKALEAVTHYDLQAVGGKPDIVGILRHLSDRVDSIGNVTRPRASG